MAKRSSNSKTTTIKPGVDVKGSSPSSIWAMNQVSMCRRPGKRLSEKRTRREGDKACAER